MNESSRRKRMEYSKDQNKNLILANAKIQVFRKQYEKF
jgi:hypothetical protein